MEVTPMLLHTRATFHLVAFARATLSLVWSFSSEGCHLIVSPQFLRHPG